MVSGWILFRAFIDNNPVISNHSFTCFCLAAARKTQYRVNNTYSTMTASKNPFEFQSSRMRREARTVTLMIQKYCQDHHQHTQDTAPCPDCAELLRYALTRLERCPFQANKNTCAKCPIHCYAPDKRTRIREVMRYAGPRLLWSHPYLSLMHLLDGLRPACTKD